MRKINRQKKDFTTEGNITEISSRNGWNYIFCNLCAKILQKMGGNIICKNAQNQILLAFYGNLNNQSLLNLVN